MASLQDTPSYHQTEKTIPEEHLRCAICLDILQDPRLLPCLHAYCLKCLKAVVGKQKPSCMQIKCAQCRASHCVPKGGVSGFPPDHGLFNAVQQHALKSKKAPPKPLHCSLCAEDDPATSYCSTCAKYLCDFCLKAHKRQMDFRGHKISSLTELESDTIVSFEQSLHCPLHAGELLKVYCKTCQKLICRDCIVVEHHAHKYGFTSDIRPQVQKEISEIVTELKRKEQEFTVHLAFLQGMEDGRHQHGNLFKQLIKSKFDSFIKTLEDLRDKLLEQEETSMSQDLKKIWAEKQFVQMTLDGISSALRYTDRLCTCPSDTTMLAMQSEAVTQFSNLKSAEWCETKLKLSLPKTFATAMPNLENCGRLKNISLKDISISIHMETPSHFHRSGSLHAHQHNICDQQQSTVTLGEKIVLSIEVKTPTTSCPILPAFSVAYCNNGEKKQYSNYACQYKGEGLWKLEFLPPSTGKYVISVDEKLAEHFYNESEAVVSPKVYRTSTAEYTVIVVKQNQHSSGHTYNVRSRGDGKRAATVTINTVHQRSGPPTQDQSSSQELYRAKPHREYSRSHANLPLCVADGCTNSVHYDPHFGFFDYCSPGCRDGHLLSTNRAVLQEDLKELLKQIHEKH